MEKEKFCCPDCKEYLEKLGINLEVCKALCEIKKNKHDAQLSFCKTGLKVLEVEKEVLYDGTVK